MDWLEHVTEGGFLRSIFDGRAPALDPVDLHEVRFERDGARCMLRFDLPEFPTTLPKAWIGSGYTVVQVQVMAIGISACRLDGWQTAMRGAMTIDRAETLRISVVSPACALSIAAEHLRVHAVSAYCRRA